jgi:hypothetical protein
MYIYIYIFELNPLPRSSVGTEVHELEVLEDELEVIELEVLEVRVV